MICQPKNGKQLYFFAIKCDDQSDSHQYPFLVSGYFDAKVITKISNNGLLMIIFRAGWQIVNPQFP